MKIFSNYDDHIFFIDFNNFLRDYKDKNFSFFNTSVEDSDKHISKLFKNYDYNGEHVFIHLGYEPHIPQETDPTLLNLLFEKDIDLDKVYVITSNYNYRDSHIKHIHFEYYEYAMQQIVFKNGNFKRWDISLDVDVVNKRHDKKFLCLNGFPHNHRKDITNFFINNNLIEQSSYSYKDKDIHLVYDEKFDKIYHNNNTIEENRILAYDTSCNLLLDEEFSYENSVYVITESCFNDNPQMIAITEKTYKAMLLKMPFIIIGQPGSLKFLKSLGYKTFNHMWSEQYDDITDPLTRMNKIKELILNLSKVDLKTIISDNYDTLEYNYRKLLSRRPEKPLLDTLWRLP